MPGCGNGDVAGARQEESRGQPTDDGLLGEGSRSYHFGTVVNGPGKALVHHYRLTNHDTKDVKVVDVVNHKPCCGVVRIGKMVLHPGEETDVEVKLVVGEKYGDVVHEAEVVTDPPTPGGLVLRTMAGAFAAIRVEEVTSPEDPSGGARADRPSFASSPRGARRNRPWT